MRCGWGKILLLVLRGPESGRHSWVDQLIASVHTDHVCMIERDSRDVRDPQENPGLGQGSGLQILNSGILD